MFGWGVHLTKQACIRSEVLGPTVNTDSKKSLNLPLRVSFSLTFSAYSD